MDCVCGCGTKVKRGLVEAQLQSTEVALELLAWDKARTERRFSGPEAAQVDSLVHRGSLQYQRLLDAIHGERESAPIAEGESWLADSQARRLGRQHMTEKGWVRKARLRLTEDDLEILDRKHPERSFSGRGAGPEEPAPDIVTQLERLGALHAEGVLNDEELTAAKRRVLG